MTLVQLRYFQMVCNLGSTSQAAEALNISQPSVSNAIKELESEFQVTLFQRQSRGMKLTEEGRQFLELTRHLLSHAERVKAAMEDIGKNSREIRLGVPPMIGSLFLPQIYHGFQTACPDRKIAIEEHGSKRLTEQLENGELDAAFLPHSKPFGPDYQSVKITDLETVCCVSPVHPLVHCRKVNVTELKDQKLVMFKNSFFQTNSLLERFRAAGLHPNVLLYTDQLSTITRMVSRNIAIGFMFSRLSDASTDVVSIPLDPPMQVQVSLVWKHESLIAGSLLQFVEYMNKRAQENSETPSALS